MSKSANATPAPAKTVSFCSVNPKVADLRAAIGDSSAKIYLKDGNRYDEQPDAAALNTTLTYYYTIQHIGKCISPKAVVSFGISAATLKGDYNKITTCPTTVAQLKAEIKAGEPGRRTEELKVYEGTADPPTSAPLADNTPITAEHYSYTYTQTGRCESPIRIADIIKPAAPTPQLTQTICGGTATVAALQPQGTTIRWYNVATGGSPLSTTTALANGDYYVAQANAGGTCESPRVKVTVALINLVKPTITVTAATCTSPSKAKITNYQIGATYWEGATQLTVNASGEITTPLAVGTHSIIAKQDTCSSTASDSFTITAQVAAPATPTVTSRTECPTSVSTQFDMATLVTPATGHTLKWYDAATGGTALAASPKVERQVTSKVVTTKYVSQEKNGCESARIAVTYTIDDTQVPTLTVSDIVLDCSAANFDTLVANWLATAAATDTCTTPVVTNNYTKPTDVCGAGEIVVTFTAKDSFGNQTQKTGKIRFIVAKDDDYTSTPVTPSSSVQVVKDGSGTPYNILTNDKLYGNGATTSNVTISEVTPNTNVKIDTATGQVKVQPNTPAGTYTVTYRICDKNISTACSNIATVKIKVPSVIDAVDDPEVSVPRTGGTVSILTNDTLNGNPATTSNVTITVTNDGGLTGLTVDGTGKLVVPNNSTPGTYTITYEICDKANSNVCDTATAKIKVPSVIDAVDDPEVSVPRTGGTVSILTNDTLNGNPATTSNVTITVTNDGGLTGLTVDGTGKLVVPNNTTPGTYTITYEICDKANPGVCDTAVVKIKVTGTTSTIDAVDDGEKTLPRTGGIVEVLTNDTLNGSPATKDNVTVAIDNNGGLTGLTVNGDGKLVVPNNTTPNTYTVTYKICDKANPGVCDTAVVKITIVTGPVIDAVNDPDVTMPRTGGNINILSNDTLNGNPATKDNVRITIEDNDGLTVLMIDPDTGFLVVPNNAPVGVYMVTYKICAKANAGLCDTAKVRITITGGAPRYIEAIDDGVWEVGTQGEFLTPSILDNDRLGSKVGLVSSDVLIERTQGQPAPDNHLVMNDDGRITVRRGIAIGTYIYYYTIIDRANSNQTSSAKAIIKVVNFVAQQDEFEITNTKNTPKNTPSVITNDEIDGRKSPVIGTDVTLTPGTPSHPNLQMNPDGTITIAPNTPDGTYTYEYTICRVSAPGDCKTAKAIIELHPALEANDDDYSAHPVNPAQQPIVVGNVLDNDTLAGAKITDPTKVAITLIDNDGLSGVSFAPNGEITVPQGANEGTYRVRYNLCMAQQLSVCDDAVVTIVITKDKPLTIYNGVSSNNDGKNDGFTIEGIEAYPKNTLKIFNRWGVLVYEKEGYTNAEPFDGYSNGRSTVEQGKRLPQGTYYYILDYQDSVGQTHNHSGWLYLKKE